MSVRLSAAVVFIGVLGLCACAKSKVETDSSAEPSAIGSSAPTGQPAPAAELPTEPATPKP